MSLILEALRRSEAERRRGAPPGLLDGAPLRAATPRPIWPLMLGGVILGAALAGGVLWWVIGDGMMADDSPPAARTPETPRAANVPPLPVLSTRREVPATSPFPEAPAASAAPTVFAAPEAAIAPEASTAPLRSASPVTLATPPEPDIAEPPDRLTGPAAGDVSRANLSAEALPPLRLSMHVFAEVPAQRFAILDGQRVREGDRVTDDLQVLEIRRDGLRLSWQGRVLWLPR